MDSVLHTLVVILFILIPGFLFRRVYYQGGFSKQFDSKSWSHSLFYSIIFGLIIEILSIIIYAEYIADIKSQSVLEFYDKISNKTLPVWIFNLEVLISLLKFMAILLGVSFALGTLCYQTVRRFKLDRKFKSLRFNNHWHYFFTGEIKDFKEFKHITGVFQCSNVDALVNTQNGKNILYTGFLSSHSICSNTGNLEAIYLTFPRRYDMENKVWKDIPSDVLIIPNSQIINLNIRFTFKKSEPVPWGALLFICSIIFLWIDYFNFFTDFILISKIVFKFMFSIIILFWFASASILFRTKDKDILLTSQDGTKSKPIHIVLPTIVLTILLVLLYNFY